MSEDQDGQMQDKIDGLVKQKEELKTLLGLAERQRDGLQEQVEQLKEHNERLLNEGDMLEKELFKANDTISNYAVVVQKKLTRRQQKNFPKWLVEIRGSMADRELKLKETFPFPKISMRRFGSQGGKHDREALRYLITGLTDREGLTGFTNEEATDIVEYLNTFPENQHHLKNMDADLRSDEETEKQR